MQPVVFDVSGPDDILEGYGTDARARIERGSSSAMSNAVEITTVAIESGKTQYEVWDPTGLATHWYRIRYSKAVPLLSTDYSDFGDVFQVGVGQFVPTGQVRALVKTSLGDDQLRDVILREEAVLAAEVGPLAGERIDVFTITEDSAPEPIRLRRPTSTISITEANTVLTDVRLAADQRTVLRLTAAGWQSSPWAGVVEVTSTPNDSGLVASHVIELVRAKIAKTGYLDEPNADKIDYAATLRAAVRAILGPTRRPSVLSVRMSTDASPAAAWLGGVRP